MFHTPTEIFQNCSSKNVKKLHFFKWQPPFVTLDINVKFNSKPTFINIMYAYSQPFWRNCDFLSKIFFFYQTIVSFEFLFKNRMQ
jgi:hypothetical protein